MLGLYVRGSTFSKKRALRKMRKRAELAFQTRPTQLARAMAYTLRALSTPEEMAWIEALQAEIWPGSALDVVPRHVLLIQAAYGGLVAAAFVPERQEPIGFVYGFPGLEPKPEGGWRLKHCSHMLGVLPAYRDGHVGLALKRFQRDFVRAQGIELITWTFDPLESRNAYLNLRRLGGIVRRYRRNLYGPLRDALNYDLPTDRLEVEWWITQPRVQARLSGLDPPPKLPPPINQIDAQHPVPHPVAWRWPERAERISVCLPARMRDFRGQDPGRDRAWRMHLRAVFEEVLARGWAITDYVLSPDRTLGYYILEPEDRLDVPRRHYALSHPDAP